MKKQWSASYNKLAMAIWVACLGSAGQQALAQQQSAQNEQPVEEVTVTGSRLVTTGTNTPTPVTAVTAADLQSMNPGELVNALSQLPQFYNNLSTQQAVGGSVAPGGSNVNLRGLDAQRTLVLLDGHRLGPSNKFGTVDIGVIPETLLQSVEAVTGGASAAYGADAVAGVVNFRLDKAFSGLKYSVQGGTTTYRDDTQYKVGVAYGTDVGEKGHIVASVENFHKDGVWGLKSLQDRSDVFPLRAWVTGQAPGPNHLTERYVQPTNYTAGGVLLGPALNSTGAGVALPASLDHLEFLPDGSGQTQLLTFSGVGQFNGGCNCQALSSLDYGVDAGDQVDAPADRYSAFVHYDYNVNDRNSFYFESLLADTSDSLAWQTAALLGPWVGRVYVDNPYLPASVRQTMTANGITSVNFGIFTPNTPGNPFEGGQLVAKNRYGQFTGGFSHDLPDSFLAGAWTLDGYVQYAQNRQETVVPGGMRTDRLFLAMDAVTDPATGQPACSVTLANPGIFDQCVPINLFGGTAAVTPDAAHYVTDDGKIARGRTTEDDAEITLRGNLTHGSGVLGPISAAFGLSWREEQLGVRTVDPCDEYPCTIGGVRLSDLGLMSPDLRGIEAGANPDGTRNSNPNGIPGLRYVPPGFAGDSNSSTVLFSSQRAVEGGYNVREAFFEFGIPLLQDGKLNLDEAARSASYSGSGNTVAWKSGVSYQVTPTLRLRATRSQDVRAPTLQERFESQRGGVNVNDPAQPGDPVISTASFSGGNPDVGLEQALTSVFGIVYQPVAKFSMTVDAYDVNLSDAIGQLRAQDIVNTCWASVGHNSSSLCQYVHRDAPLPGQTYGEINRVDSLYINLSNQRVKGTDVEFNYGGINVGSGGTLNWRLLGTRLNENSVQTPGSLKDERAGDVGAGLPKNKVTTSVTYAHGPYSIFLQGRYIGGGTGARAFVQSDVAITGVQTINDNTVASVVYTDLRFDYNGGRSGGTPWQVFFSANNLFNTVPPDTYPGLGRAGVPGPSSVLYDTIGRRFAAGVRVNF